MNLDHLRETLIASIHSDDEATESIVSRLHEAEMVLSLCTVCAPYDKYSDDCRMQASYLLSKAEPKLLAEIMPLICAVLTIPHLDYVDMNRKIACHLITAIRKALPYFEGTLYHDLDAIADEYGCPKNVV